MSDGNASIEMTIEVVASYVGKNNVHAEDVPALIASIHAAIKALDAPVEQPPEDAEPEHVPAVSVRKSLASRDHILSMIDGKPYKTLKRHLSRHGLTPAQYRERYGLKSDYPMVAATYSEARKAMAKAIGLGRKAVTAVEHAVGIEPVAPKRRGRKPKAAVSGAAG